jgi:hypothetical protein
MIWVRMPFATCEPIECFSKVLNRTPLTCGLGIGKGPDVVFRVSFSIAIMSLVLSLKFWKQNNGVLTCFYATSHIWSWHSISWVVENCVFYWCTPGTWEFDTLATCGVIVSSPLANKVCSLFVLKGWKNCGMTTRVFLTLVIGFEPDVSPSVWITCLMANTQGVTITSFAMK